MDIVESKVEASVTFSVSKQILDVLLQNLTATEGQQALLFAVLMIFICSYALRQKQYLWSVFGTLKRFSLVLLTQNSLRMLGQVQVHNVPSVSMAMTVICVYIVCLSIFLQMSSGEATEVLNKDSAQKGASGVATDQGNTGSLSQQISSVVYSVQYALADTVTSIISDVHVRRLFAALSIICLVYVVKVRGLQTARVCKGARAHLL